MVAFRRICYQCIFSFLPFFLFPSTSILSSLHPPYSLLHSLPSPAPGPLCPEIITQVLISVASLTGSTGITGPQRYTWSPWTTCTYELFCICSFQKKNESPLKVAHVYIVCCRALQVLMDLQARKETWWVSKRGIKKGVDSKIPFHILLSLP